MKFYFFAILHFLTIQLKAQLPTIKAVGGSGINVNWEKIWKEKEILYNKEFIINGVDNGPGWNYNDCEQGGGSAIKASSTLPSQGTKNYDKSNLTDGTPLTAWVEGKSDYGIGEYFEIETLYLNSICNGYQFSPTTWINNSRVKKFKVYKNDVPICYLELTDEMGEQSFSLPERNDILIREKKDSGNITTFYTFKFEIVEVYEGLKWADVAISDLNWYGCCFSENTVIESGNNFTNISEITTKDSIYSVDIENKKIESVSVTKVVQQKHTKLLRLITENRSIEITPSHPIYFKNKGFSSIENLMKQKRTNDYNELINETEFLIWDSKQEKFVYEQLKKIEELNDSFNTYSILGLSKGESYLVNGFVTKVY